MALITCSDCGNPVSPRASSCPKCGAPVQSAHAPEEILADGERRRSSGRLIKILSSIAMIVGIIMGAGASTGSEVGGMVAGLLLFGGFFGFVIGRFFD
jgi:uncharacterized membrane protein YvbJ